MPGSEYAVNIPVNVYGLDQTDRLQGAIAKTAEATRISAADFRTWAQAMQVSTDAGYTFNSALGKVSSTLKTAGIEVGGFTDRLKQNIRESDQATASLTRLEQVAGRVGGRLGGMASGIPGGGFIGSQAIGGLGLSGGAALGVGVAAAGIFGAMEYEKHTSELAKWAQGQVNLSRELGVSVSQMQQLSRASEITGVNLDATAKSAANMGEAMMRGGERAKEISSALAQLGLGQGTAFQNPADSINQIARALAGISDPAERARLAVQLLGESGRSLAAVASDLTSAINKGHIIDDASMERLSKAQQNLKSFGEMWDILVSRASKPLTFIISTIVGKGGPSASGLPGAGAMFPPHKPFEEMTADDWRTYEKQNSQFIQDQTTNTPDQKSDRLTQFNNATRGVGTPADIYKSTISEISTKQETLKQQYVDGKITEPAMRRQYASLEAQKAGAEATRKRAEEIQRQREELKQMEARPVRPDEAGKTLLEVRRKFNLLDPSEYQGYAGFLFKQAQPYITAGNREHLSGIAERFKDEAVKSFAYSSQIYGPDPAREAEQRNRGIKAVDEDQKRIDAEAEAKQRNYAQAVTSSVSNFGAGARSKESVAVSQARLLDTFRAGTSRYGLSPLDAAALDYRNSRASINAELSPQVSSLRERAGYASYGASKLDPGEARQKLEQEATDLSAQAKEKEIEATTKSVDAINKFNDSIDKAREAMRDTFSNGFASMILGAQTGGAKGLRSSAMGFVQHQESILLNNVGHHIWDGGIGATLQSGASKLGLPKWMTTGMLGFGDGGKLDPKIELNTNSTDKNTTATDRLTGALSQIYGRAGNTPGTTTIGGTIYDSSGNAIDTAAPSDSTSSTLSDLSTGAGIASGIAGATGSAPASAVIKDVANGLSSISKSLTAKSPFATLGDPNSSFGQDLGAVASIAGAGLAAYQGISSLAKGGARNVTGGIGELLGAAAVFGGPAAPFLAGGAALAGIVGSILPDPRTTRSNQISKNIFQDQYMAPPAENLSVGSNGGYADLNFQGGVRTSNLSPYPVVSDPYLDVPRRTNVPGHTISTFGGLSTTPGAIVTPQPPHTIPPQVHYHTWNVMDAQSFRDVLTRNPSAVADGIHHAVNSGHSTEMVHAIAQHLGLR